MSTSFWSTTKPYFTNLWRYTSVVATIANSTPNDGDYTWNVPTNLTVANNYYVKVGFLGRGPVQGDFFSITEPANTKPSATTNPATNIGDAGASLNGLVNPNGATTTCYYDFGTTTSYGEQLPVTGTFTGTSSQPVPWYRSNMQPQTTYHFRLVATNAAGSSYGSDQSFTTTTSWPTVTTIAATGVTSTTATLNGSVDPNSRSTTYHFEYGTTTSYGKQTSDLSAGYGTSAIDVSAPLSDLTSGALYHYRLVATSSGGTSQGSDMTFTTSLLPGPLPDPPTLISPTSGATNVSLSPILSWNASSGAAAYRLQVSLNSTFSTTIFDQSNPTVTEQTPTGY